MGNKAAGIDLTMMFAMHHALRRELTHIARITARPDPDPRWVLRTAAGWEMFKAYLLAHHTSEDDAIWPVMARALTGRADDLALLDAMEAEHAAVGPLLDAIDTAVADRSGGLERLGDLADSLVTALTSHLKHEENDVLPLLAATLTAQQWELFSELHRNRIGTGPSRYLPWLLQDASAERTEAVLSLLPEAVRQAYRDEWRPAYTRLSVWDPGGETASP